MELPIVWYTEWHLQIEKQIDPINFFYFFYFKHRIAVQMPRL